MPGPLSHWSESDKAIVAVKEAKRWMREMCLGRKVEVE